MGTMSRTITRHTRKPQSPTYFDRELTGERLTDVLHVVTNRRAYTRPVRRLVMALIRRHARAVRLPVHTSLDAHRGIVLPDEHPIRVAGRLLNWAGLL